MRPSPNSRCDEGIFSIPLHLPFLQFVLHSHGVAPTTDGTCAKRWAQRHLILHCVDWLEAQMMLRFAACIARALQTNNTVVDLMDDVCVIWIGKESVTCAADLFAECVFYCRLLWVSGCWQAVHSAIWYRSKYDDFLFFCLKQIDDHNEIPFQSSQFTIISFFL